MAVSDVEAVLEFLRNNGFSEAESALKEDMIEKSELGSFDFEKFFFPMVPPPPVRIPSTLRGSGIPPDDGESSRSNSRSGDDEFVSLGSSTSDVCSSEFINPYGVRSTSHDTSEASSENLSQFGTARDYHDFDMQNDLFWYDEKDDGDFMTPSFDGPDFFGCPSEDKFVMMSENEKQHGNPLEEKCLFYIDPLNDENEVHMVDYDNFDRKYDPGGCIQEQTKGITAYDCLAPIYTYSVGAGGFYGDNLANNSYMSSKETDLNGSQLKVVGDIPTDCGAATQDKIRKTSYSAKRGCSNDWVEGFKDSHHFNVKVAEKDFIPNGIDSYEFGDGGKVNSEPSKPEAAAEGEDFIDDLLMYDTHEDEYEVFDLRIIHRKNRTGFEENKDLPIVLNTVIAGRYYITEYLGSAAFSKVVQAHDLHTGMDVCLKIIKNDKDFFDQSLDEIKLLKLVNKYDPSDERHILRLYDFFYHQEHLFIVCELLRANLYEFQKFNQESGGEAYFTLSRLQVITHQCLEALEYLHHLGIIHCDLKPENILIKSYRRCEIKVIDLGSSCFLTDNLCLYVQSRSYRAPEVILGLPYDQRIDIWSLGCILAELCSGEVLFPNDSIVTILARMIGMFGPIDLEMLEQGQETNKYFTKEYDLYHINEETDELEYIIPESSSLEHQLQVTDIGFIDFVKSLLEIDPKRRPTAMEALEHPWLSHRY
ncbi:LOW QUALITY PROTEIN: dual specificity tyrosine-phosphorylation-regulated kinase 2-like [Juglans microcarpa x Juglans regia]|uniref:LOW QUALITY PROTEIN: dual specificity tyrosine-phosphorylation-regulated kinase 2-like n=1 Tax=Juglans microcarpa x Juglans regia TaxID=2249226 RepID=UPI001B7E6CEE|nr:LOW QUALITY PROTEIN: dual specificity tyrosine-phosphorylation-regulated kinase 2-like [Juglans microcarpa x Juglans regia]